MDFTLQFSLPHLPRSFRMLTVNKRARIYSMVNDNKFYACMCVYNVMKSKQNASNYTYIRYIRRLFHTSDKRRNKSNLALYIYVPVNTNECNIHVVCLFIFCMCVVSLCFCFHLVDKYDAHNTCNFHIPHSPYYAFFPLFLCVCLDDKRNTQTIKESMP